MKTGDGKNQIKTRNLKLNNTRASKERFNIKIGGGYRLKNFRLMYPHKSFTIWHIVKIQNLDKTPEKQRNLYYFLSKKI
jgi:hypothetical protein